MVGVGIFLFTASRPVFGGYWHSFSGDEVVGYEADYQKKLDGIK